MRVRFLPGPLLITKMVITENHNIVRVNKDSTSIYAANDSTWADLKITEFYLSNTTSCNDYDTFTYTSYRNNIDYRELEIQLKKSLKKLMDKMSKEGWIEHIDHYITPKLPSMKLRAVRLDGRGWASH